MNTDNFPEELYFSPGDLLGEQSSMYLHLLLSAGSTGAPGSERIMVSPDVNPELAQKIAGSIGLTFVSERKDDGNLCLADSGEVMPEFRETCTPTDLLKYVLGLLNSPGKPVKPKNPGEIDAMQIGYPKDVLVFWKAVEAGRQAKIAFYRKK